MLLDRDDLPPGLRRLLEEGNFPPGLAKRLESQEPDDLIQAVNQDQLPDDLAAKDEGPVDQAVSREALRLLAEAVAQLPADFRAAFLLRAEEGLSFREIASVLGLTEETARWRVFKARHKLLSVLAPQLEMQSENRNSKSETNSKDK